MKKTFLKFSFLVLFTVLFSSCYVNTFSVGKGAQTGVQVKKMNHYLVYGLAPIATSDPQKMANGAENYDVTIKHSFIDGLINALTGGLYTPTTTIVTK